MKKKPLIKISKEDEFFKDYGQLRSGGLSVKDTLKAIEIKLMLKKERKRL